MTKPPATSARFDEVLSIIAADLKARGFQRKRIWFTRRPFADERFWCVSIRKIPQVASKRIVFQVVSSAGRTQPGDMSPIGTLNDIFDYSTFDHHIIDGNMEKLWTVWPSTDVQALSAAVIAAIAESSLKALEAYSFEA